MSLVAVDSTLHVPAIPRPRIIPRRTVHALSRRVFEQTDAHRRDLTRLMDEQRALSRYVRETVVGLGRPQDVGLVAFYAASICRVFDLVGGRLRKASREDLLASEARIGRAVGRLGVDVAFGVRAETWRAQPHLVDEAAEALLTSDGAIDPDVRLPLFLILWVAIEALDAAWQPPPGFAGELEYRHVDLAADDARGEA